MTVPMNPFFAASLFDHPLVVVVVFIVGALVNWLAKRHQEMEDGGHPPTGNKPPSTIGKPSGKIDLEETLRRLLEEPPPTSVPAPPPLPRPSRVEPPPVPSQSANKTLPPIRPPVSALRPTPSAKGPARSPATTAAANQQLAQADRRSDPLNEQGSHPAPVVSHAHPTRRIAKPWRNPRSARQAFIGSVVFAPPKSLEL